MRRLLRRAAIALAALAAVAAVAGWLALRASLPALEGELRAAGAEAEIVIRRGAHGIPHVEAESARDAWFGLGFVHGQDRLAQMEFARRAGRGELAELFGARLAATDRYFRTLGLHRAADSAAAALPEADRRLLDAYAAGVDAAAAEYLLPPPELLVLARRPAPWTAADSVLAVKTMALQLSGNAAGEALRAEMKAALDPAAFAAAWPAPARGAPPPGSNNWVVGPERSATGAPLLANDPHLGLSAPAVWYLAHLRAPGLDVLGATIPGIPAVVAGRNRTAAWGVTNTGPDTQDLFIVTEADVTGRRAEEIRVRGGDSIAHEVRETRFGPVVSDLPGFAGPEMRALAWTALDGEDTTVAAGFRLARAATVDALFAALEDYRAPMQNFALADSAGTIGFIAAGRVPVRRAHDGWLPVPAAGGAGDWTGYVPYGALPRLRDPPGGLIVTANQDVTPPGYRYLLSRDWPEDYRARRIREALAGRSGLTAADFAALQTDTLSLMAREFLPLMLPAVAGAPLYRPLAEWDGRMDADRAEPLVFQAWYRALAQGLIRRNLPRFAGRYGGRRPAVVRAALTGANAWCGGSCDDELAAALDEAAAWLSARHGADPAKWRWGVAHRALARHLPSDAVPLVRALFAIEREHGGGPYTVMQANTRIDDEDAPFAETHGAGLRLIFDLSGVDGTQAIIHTGQSGHPLSPHYSDLADSWAAGAYLTVPMSPEAVAAAAPRVLRLTPLREAGAG